MGPNGTEERVRIAAIDIGTNSIHMVIADATRGETFAVLDREREVVQVGRGSFHDGRLRGDAMRRTAAALRRFVQLARRHAVDRILCTATAAVREAKNGGDFLRLARREAGVSPPPPPPPRRGGAGRRRAAPFSASPAASPASPRASSRTRRRAA